MKSQKMNGLTRLLAFFLIAIILISVVCIAVGGRQLSTDIQPDNSDIGLNTENTDENKDGINQDELDQNGDQNPPEQNVPETPKYYNSFTGLEVSEEQSNAFPIAFLVDSTCPLYGISGSDITIEIPTENGNTRFLVFQTNTNNLWKIGSLAPARAFISSLTNLFGGIIVSYGNDDIIKYDNQNYNNVSINIKNNYNSYYVENSKFIYSNIDRIRELLNSASNINSNSYKLTPFVFSESKVLGNSSANTIILPYSETSETGLYYSSATDKYCLYKSGIKSIDKLYGTDISYTNAFVLFTNTTTYESRDGKELVLDTLSGGFGYYASSGTITEIQWCVNESGELVFKNLSGQQLSVNKGNSYIGYYKASVSAEVCFR